VSGYGKMDIDHIQTKVSYHQSATDQKKKEWVKAQNKNREIS